MQISDPESDTLPGTRGTMTSVTCISLTVDFDNQHMNLQTNLLGTFSMEKVTNLILDDHFYHHSYKKMRVKNSRKENVDDLRKLTQQQIRDAQTDDKIHAQIKEHAKHLGKQKTKKENLVLIKKDEFHNSGFIFGHLFEVENGVYMTTKRTIEEAMRRRVRGQLHLTEEFVLQTHARIMEDMKTSRAGKYRTFNLHVGGECTEKYDAGVILFLTIVKLSQDAMKPLLCICMAGTLLHQTIHVSLIILTHIKTKSQTQKVAKRLIKIRISRQLQQFFVRAG